MTADKQLQTAKKLLLVIKGSGGKISLYKALNDAGMSMQDWYGYSFSKWFLYTYGVDGSRLILYDKKNRTFTLISENEELEKILI